DDDHAFLITLHHCGSLYSVMRNVRSFPIRKERTDNGVAAPPITGVSAGNQNKRYLRRAVKGPGETATALVRDDLPIQETLTPVKEVTTMTALRTHWRL